MRSKSLRIRKFRKFQLNKTHAGLDGIASWQGFAEAIAGQR